MHVLFVHQNFPAQFGHIARHLIRSRGWRCSFVSQTPSGEVAGIRKVQYKAEGGARETTHYCSRTFENAVWQADAVYKACKAERDLRPDLIVGHSGFGSTLFLPELYPRCARSWCYRALADITPATPTWTSAPSSCPPRSTSSASAPATR